MNRLLVFLFMSSLAILGCNKNKDAATGSQPMQGPQPAMPGPGMPGAGPPPEEVLAKLPGGEEFAAGKKLYANNKCANCHKLGETGSGPGGKMGGPPGRGPDLTSTGANPEHTRQWLADHIRDPKTHKAESRMPTFGPDRISDADLALLAEYLASRK